MATEEEQQEQQRKQKGFFLQQWLADRVQQGNRELESQSHLLLQQFSHVQQSQAGGKKTNNNNNKVSFVSLNRMGAAPAGRGRRHNGGRQQQGGFASLSASGIEPKVKVVISPSPSLLHSEHGLSELFWICSYVMHLGKCVKSGFLPPQKLCWRILHPKNCFFVELGRKRFKS